MWRGMRCGASGVRVSQRGEAAKSAQRAGQRQARLAWHLCRHGDAAPSVSSQAVARPWKVAKFSNIATTSSPDASFKLKA